MGLSGRGGPISEVMAVGVLVDGGRRLLVLALALLTFGVGRLTSLIFRRGVTARLAEMRRDVTVLLAEPACRAQRIVNERPETRVELKGAAGGRCLIEHVDVVEWTADRSGFVLLKSHGGDAFVMRLRRDMVEGFWRPGLFPERRGGE